MPDTVDDGSVATLIWDELTGTVDLRWVVETEKRLVITTSGFRIEVLLSLQRALWDLVTPSLRGVAVTPTYPIIKARFIFETVGEDEEMIVSEAGAYVVADFVPPVDIHFTAVPLAPSLRRELGPVEEWVYRRQESGAT